MRMVLLLMSEGTKWWAVRSKLQVGIWASSMAVQAEVSAASNQPQAKELCTGLEISFFTRQSRRGDCCTRPIGFHCHHRNSTHNR